MTVDVRIEKLRFSGAEEPIEVGESNLVALFGPNNAGKSMALREIAAFIRGGGPGSVVRPGIEARREGTEGEMVEWLDGLAGVLRSTDAGRGVVTPGGGFMAGEEGDKRPAWSAFQAKAE